MADQQETAQRMVEYQRVANVVTAELKEVHRLRGVDLMASMKWRQSQDEADKVFLEMMKGRGDLTRHIIALEQARNDLIALSAELQSELMQRNMNA